MLFTDDDKRLDERDLLEESVLGAVFLNPGNLALLPTLEVEDFAGFRAKAVWTAMRNLEARNQPIDVTTVGDEIARDGMLEAVGWAFLGTCAARVPTTTNAIEYARRLKDHRLRHRLCEVLSEVLAEAKSRELTGADLLSMALGGLSVLDAEQPESAYLVGDLLKRRVKQLEEIAKERALGLRTMTGFPTGVEKLDDILGGWQPGIVTIVAARPAMGKSSLGLATADACTATGTGVHLFSLEDTEDAYADRVLSRTSRVPAEALRNAQLQRGEMESVGRALTEVTKRKGWLIDSRSGITAEEIVRSVRRHRKPNETRVVIVDYVQLVKPANGSKLSRHESLTEIVTTFADAAKHDGLAYVVMSQLNREIEKREDKRPQLADLRESGSLEERAKCVVGLYRGSVYYQQPKKGIDYSEDRVAPPTPEQFQRQVQLLVIKNNNGKTGRVVAEWNGPTTTIR